jgi:hypothetical protein
MATTTSLPLLGLSHATSRCTGQPPPPCMPSPPRVARSLPCPLDWTTLPLAGPCCGGMLVAARAPHGELLRHAPSPPPGARRSASPASGAPSRRRAPAAPASRCRRAPCRCASRTSCYRPATDTSTSGTQLHYNHTYISYYPPYLLCFHGRAGQPDM